MKSTKYAFLLGIATFVLFACQKKLNTPLSDKLDNTVTGADSTINKTLLLQLVNDVRKKGCNCGSAAMPPVDTVAWNVQLEAAARAHAADMSKNNYFSHTGLDSSSAGTRITAAGYNWQAYGENIARGYTSEQTVINAWLQSEGHCKNIMNGNFKEMGVGMVNSYWVQDFGTKQ